MATIKDVARLAGVSVATVSRVINNSPKASEASRLAVHSAMESLSYHPNANARALAQQTTETVGLVVGDVSDPFFGAMVKAVEQVAYHTGNFLLIGNGYHNEQKERQAIEQLIRHRCAALVVHAKMIPDADLASLMKQMPGMVLINRILPGFENRCIALDDRYGAWLATRHLIQQGHTRIGYLCSNHSISDAEDRLQGYYDALAESGIAANDRLEAYRKESGEQIRQFLASRDDVLKAYIVYTFTCQNELDAAGSLEQYADLGPQAQKSIYGQMLAQRAKRLDAATTGKPAPDFTLDTPDGKSITLSSVEARIKIVDFWASWCGPCRLNNPKLKEIYAAYKDKGLEIIGVSLDTDKRRWTDAVAKDGLPWIQVSSLKGWKCPVASLYGVSVVPAMFVIDASNNIIATGLKGEALEQFIARTLEQQ